MLNRLPRGMPTLAMMIEDIGSPSPQQIAKALHVSAGTVRRWIKAEQAPRAVMFALFFITRWGQSQVHCDAHNDAKLQAGLALALRGDLQRAHEKMAHLGRIGDFGAANDPIPETPRSPPAHQPAPAPGLPLAQTATKRRSRSTAKTAQSN